MIEARVVFLHGPRDLRVQEVSVSDPAPEQVLVQLKAAGICGSDVACYEGRSAEGRYDIAPYTPGHEWAGVAAAVGSSVVGVKAGDKVTGDCVLRCFKCDNCKRGLMPAACVNFREVGFRPDSPGGLGEYLLLEQPYVHKLPDDWTFEEGALVEPFGVGYFGVWSAGGWVDASDDVVIFGAGPIGLSALMVCKTARSKVVVVEPLPNRRTAAKKLGADLVLDPAEEFHLVTKVDDYFGTARGASLIIEASGTDEALATVFDVAGYQARVRLIGHSVGRKVPIEIGKTIWRGLSVSGRSGVSEFTPRTIAFIDRMRQAADIRAMISHRIPFDDVGAAMELAAGNKTEVIKVMVTF